MLDVDFLLLHVGDFLLEEKTFCQLGIFFLMLISYTIIQAIMETVLSCNIQNVPLHFLKEVFKASIAPLSIQPLLSIFSKLCNLYDATK